MLFYQKRFTTFLMACLFLLSFSCTKKEEPKIYEKPVATKQNATVVFIESDENFYKSNYMPVFYGYYNKLIHQNDIENAAEVLEIVCRLKCRNNYFDHEFSQTVDTFVSKYQSKLPLDKTLFINYYFADFYKRNGDFKTAISYALKTTKVPVKDYNTCYHMAEAYLDLAFSYFSIGKQDLAIQCNQKSLYYFNKINSISGVGKVYNSLALIYSASGNYQKEEEYNDKAIKYFKKANDLDNVFVALENKIMLYDDTGNEKLNTLVDSTYNYFNQCKFQPKDTKVYISCCYISKLLRENNLKEAKKIIEEIQPIVKELNSIETDITFEEVVLNYKIKNNEKIDMESLTKKMIPYLIENENYQRLLLYYPVLKQNAIKKQDYKTALYYDENINEISNLLGKNSNSRKVIELDKKFQIQKKEQQITLQQKDIATKNAAIAYLAFMFLAIIIIIVVYQYKQKQKIFTREKLNAQLYTKQLLEKTEEERKRIASDLHDSISHELLTLKNVAGGKQFETNQKIDTIINDIRSISRNLHPIMFDKIGLQSSVEQLTERVQGVNNFMITSEINYNGTLATSDEIQVYRIIQEAVSNVIKYADAIAAKITINENENAVNIEIKDNGKGFNFNEIINSSKSFGLHNIIERSRAIGGEAKITSNNNGTTVAVEIKKNQ